MFLNEKMIAYARNVQPEIIQLIKDMCAIPAPSHHEEQRAEFCRAWFEKNGFENVSIDSALNVIVPLNMTDDNEITVIMAHTDTVFPDTEPMALTEKDGYLHCPGVTDDTSNLAVMMICARYFRENFRFGKRGVCFVANSCEEGLGNLKGSRMIVDTFGKRIREFVSLDAAVMNKLVNQGVGSHRYKVTARTEGGHSFGNFGNNNAIHVLASMIDWLYSIKVPQEENSKTTYNVGVISGGTSINTIAQEAEMMYEYRSSSKNCLAKMRTMFERTVEAFRATGVNVEVIRIGDRPCSGEIDAARQAALCDRVKKSMKEVLNLDAFESSGSTDCNMPLSLGIPAVCFGVCHGIGVHTREEKMEIASLYDGCRLLLDFLFSR